jgi:hypothetical protein
MKPVRPLIFLFVLASALTALWLLLQSGIIGDRAFGVGIKAIALYAVFAFIVWVLAKLRGWKPK